MSPVTGFAGGVGWPESRDDTKWMPKGSFNFTGARGGVFQSAANNTVSQQIFSNEFFFNAAKSIRTSTIVLAAFNIIAAFATAVGILCESYFRKRRNKNYKFRRNGFSFVPEADVYPLVLSASIFIQSFIFAGAQSTGLDTVFGSGCTWLAQIMLPAVFIAPYTQLVFGLELAIRALRKQPFAPRARYNVSVCLSIIGMLVLANFLIADFDQSPNFCLSSLFWFVAHYSILCFGLFVAITTIVLICTVVVFVRLHRSIKVEVTARVAASKMIYYLALAVISNGFLIPFFFVQGFMDGRGESSNALNLGMVAAVVANVSGLMTGGLYLVLKSSVLSTIGPKDKAGEYENRRALYKDRRRDTGDPDDDNGIDNQIMNPVSGPRSLRRVDSEASLLTTEKEEEASDGKSFKAGSVRNGRRSPDSVRSNNVFSAVASALMPKTPEPVRVPPTGTHIRKRSYSLFPRGTVASKSSMVLLPATTYAPTDHLKPPPSMGNLVNMRHRRDSSLVSSATVQIGIRLSSVDDLPPLAQNKAAPGDNVVHTLGCPDMAKQADVQGVKRAGAVGASADTTLPPPQVDDELPARDPVKDAKMKTLPPVPRIISQLPRVEPASEEVTLSPSVYSPNTPTKVKLPSPKGVGFKMPSPRSTSNSPPRSPPRRRATGDTPPVATDAKGAWI